MKYAELKQVKEDLENGVLVGKATFQRVLEHALETHPYASPIVGFFNGDPRSIDQVTEMLKQGSVVHGEHEGQPIVIWINPKAERTGPEMTDLDGELEHKVKSCRGCRHFGVNDQHYFYCSAQYAENQLADTQYVYPWRDAGKQFSRWPDATGCPHDTSES